MRGNLRAGGRSPLLFLFRGNTTNKAGLQGPSEIIWHEPPNNRNFSNSFNNITVLDVWEKRTNSD